MGPTLYCAVIQSENVIMSVMLVAGCDKQKSFPAHLFIMEVWCNVLCLLPEIVVRT